MSECVKNLTPDRWFYLTHEAQDCLTAWWERVGTCALRDVTLLTTMVDEGTLEITKFVRDKDGVIQVDPESGHPPTEFLKSTERIPLSEPVPDCWPTEEQVTLPDSGLVS